MKKLWNKDFILLLQGNLVSTLGDVIYSVAIGFWVYQTTGSSGLMGLMSSISMFISMFLSPFCGSIVDKVNRKSLIVLIDLMQGVIMLGVGILAYLNALSVPIVLIAAVLASFGSVFYSPSISTIMLDIIPRDDMVRGQSLYSGTSSLINLIGSAIGGVLVTLLGVPLIIIINGISNLYSAVTEMLVRIPKSVEEGEKISVKTVLGDIAHAIKVIFSDKCLKIFIPTALLVNLLGAGPFSLLLPFCYEKGFTVDMYGYLAAIFSAAYVIGALLLGAIKLKPKARFRVMSIGFSLSVPVLIWAYFSTEFLTVCILGFLAGLLNCAGNTVFNAALMLALPEKRRSAVLGFFSAASVGGTALSTLIYGLLGEAFPLYIVFAIGSALSLIPMLYLCFHRETKRFIMENRE